MMLLSFLVLVGKVLTLFLNIARYGSKMRDYVVFPFLIGKVLTTSPAYAGVVKKNATGAAFPFLIGKVLTRFGIHGLQY